MDQNRTGWGEGQLEGVSPKGKAARIIDLEEHMDKHVFYFGQGTRCRALEGRQPATNPVRQVCFDLEASPLPPAPFWSLAVGLLAG